MKNILIFLFKIALLFFILQLIIGGILFHYSDRESFIKAINLNAFASFIFAGILLAIQLIYLRIDKISIKNFDLKPTQKFSFIVDCSIDKAKQIIDNEIPMKINSNEFQYDNNKNIYTAKTGTTIRSWGEKIILSIQENEKNKTQVSIISKPVLMTTLIDFGKSLNNINKIKMTFERSAFNE